MIDFKTALATGLSMAMKVDLNKKEIDEKFQQISEMLNEGTSGKVGLVFSENNNHREAMLGNLVQNAFVVSQLDPKIGTRIATVIRDNENGYPVVIEAASSKFICTTVEDVEIAFSEIVQVNSVANAIFSMISGE